MSNTEVLKRQELLLKEVKFLTLKFTQNERKENGKKVINSGQAE